MAGGFRGTPEDRAVSISKGEVRVMKTACCVCIGLLVCAHGYPQASDYPPEQENALQKTKPGKQLFKEDEPCGAYFWKSLKADRSGAVALYFFYGSTEYGKGKLGMYPQAKYRVVLNEDKEPPTAQVIKDEAGSLKEVRVQMTKAEFQSARGCFAQQ